MGFLTERVFSSKDLSLGLVNRLRPLGTSYIDN